MIPVTAGRCYKVDGRSVNDWTFRGLGREGCEMKAKGVRFVGWTDKPGPQS